MNLKKQEKQNVEPVERGDWRSVRGVKKQIKRLINCFHVLPVHVLSGQILYFPVSGAVLFLQRLLYNPYTKQ